MIETYRNIFYQIVEQIYLIENPRLIELIESIYTEVEIAKDHRDIYNACQEIQITINEEDFTEQEEDIVFEIEQLIEKLS